MTTRTATVRAPSARRTNRSGFVIEAGVLHVVVAVVAAIGIPKALR